MTGDTIDVDGTLAQLPYDHRVVASPPCDCGANHSNQPDDHDEDCDQPEPVDFQYEDGRTWFVGGEYWDHEYRDLVQLVAVIEKHRSLDDSYGVPKLVLVGITGTPYLLGLDRELDTPMSRLTLRLQAGRYRDAHPPKEDS